jgi:hypothetical protein
VALYRACCELLVEALETQLNGREKMHQFLFGLRPGQSWQTTLCEVFGGGFGYKPGLERWWALFASRAAGMIVPQTQTWTETRQRLEEALRVEDAELASALSTGKLPEEFVKRYTHDQAKLMDLLIPVQMRVLGLAPLAHPLYRPAIGAYLESFSALGAKARAQEDALEKAGAWFEKMGGADGRRMRRFHSALERATAERRRADEGGEAMARYVGSVEASSHPEDVAGRLGNWFQGSPSGSAGARQPTTPVGEYLDKVESGLNP